MIQESFKKLGNKLSDPENFIPYPMYMWHMGSGWYTSDLHLDKGKKKVKALPLQAWTGPEGCRRLRLPDFRTISP